MVTILAGVIVAVVAIGGATCLYLRGREEKVVPKLESRTPFVIEDRDAKSVTISTVIEFRNEGTQSAMIVDAICKPQLPFEQYDGMAVRGKAERLGVPREDDYFEALVIEHQQSAKLVAKVTLTARKNLSLEAAVAHMVDFPIEFIYRHVGRNEMRYSVARIFLTAEELAKLVGVKLAKVEGRK
ncbi:MAG: hypothetical protein K6G55_02190 [Selenomonadaceae bacterium]|nr:hypothetical protein [Selenomonadaceae bacterium]